MNNKNNKNRRGFGLGDIIVMLVIIGMIFSIYFTYNPQNNQTQELSYTQLVEKLENDEVKTINATPAEGTNNDGITIVRGELSDGSSYVVNIPTDQQYDNIIQYALTNGIDVNQNVLSTFDIFSVIISILPFILIGFMMVSLLRSQGGGNNKAFEFSKSKAKLQKKSKITFKDVAGLDEEKEEMAELVDFLKDPSKYSKIGARIPKGALLVGPPGTGKTLLAKSVAGEANVPFYTISGSDFVEMFVGVGASRVRDMFKTAKQNAPCIIFIDEIDAVGRQRGAGLGGGNDEREQTLNQLLVEMDGFDTNSGIIVIAATNRPDILDPALLRPGRFDRQITIDRPDVKARTAILGVHARNKKLKPGINLEDIAHRTPGFSGADLENVLNEAALLVARKNKELISVQDIDEAIDRVMMGPAKRSRKYTDKDKSVVAYHEAGHAVIGLKLENAETVHKVTIIPRGQAGGYNLMLPDEESFFMTKTAMLNTITGLFGGRASEELHFDDVTTGASNDFERATKIARDMVTKYGMSDLGKIVYEQDTGNVFLGRDYTKQKNFSDLIGNEIDNAVREITDKCYSEAINILKDNSDLVDSIASYLIKVETLTKEDIEEINKTGHLKRYDDTHPDKVDTDEPELVEA